MANKIIHKHSSELNNNKAKLPSSGQLEYGELAVNYADGVETISMKNSKNEIVEFKSDEYYSNVFSNVDGEIDALQTQVNNKAETSHSHGTITLTGDVTGSGTIGSGTTAIKINATVANNSHTHTSSNISDSISASSGITSGATGLVQGKAVEAYAATKGHTHAGVYAPVAHASSATTYGLGTTANYGHVKISNGDVNTTAHADGLVAGMDHSHGNYSLSGHTHSAYATTGTVSALDTRVGTAETNITNLQKADTALETAYKAADTKLETAYKAADTALKTELNETISTTANGLQDQINGKLASSHTGTTATTGATGHVKLVTGDLNGKTYANGVAAAAAHTHSQYSGTGHTHSQYATTTNLNAANERISKIEGSDAGSSMRTVAADEVAKVVANAPEAFNTLKEIADWIGTGNTNTTATQMITDIAELENTVSGFTSSNTVKATTDALQNAVNGKAPKAHASTGTTYGIGTTANYGHVKISNGDVSTVASADGLVAGMDHSHSNYSTTSHTHGTITLSGDVTGSASIGSGTTAINITATVADNSHSHTSSNISNSISASSGITSSAAGLVQGKAVQGYAAPKAHASTGTTYGIGKTGGTYGHVSLITGDLNGKAHADGVAASAAHTHGQYAASGTVTALDTRVGAVESGKAPNNHASTGTTYGVGTTANYGHVKISNDDVNTVAHADGLVAGMDHSHSNYSLTGHTHNYSATGHKHTSAEITDSISASSGITSSAAGLVQGKAVQVYAAPKSHTSTATTYGVATSGDTGKYGHVKLVTGEVSGQTYANGVAAAAAHSHGDYATTNTVSALDARVGAVESGKAPKSHASSANTYGLGTTANYGHVKISNGDVNTVASADGLVAGMDHTHSNYSTTSHTHGTITLSGDVTGSATIGSGTTAIKITTTVADDSHNHTKLGTATVGASNKPIYLNAGKPTEVSSIGEAFLSWGGQSISGSITPLDAALDGSFSANRLSFMNTNGITVQYRTDGVSSTDDNGWIDYGLTNERKTNLVTTGLADNITPGKKSSGTTVNDRVRVIIDGNAGGIYFSLRKVLFYVCTNGVSNISCDIHIHNNGTNAWSKIGTYNLTGWSGWNSIGLGNYSFGASSGSWAYKKIMFIFYCDSVSGLSSGQAPIINKISMHGETAWTATGMAANGHMYTWDVSKNVTFPANVTATTFNGNATSATSATTAGTVTVGKGSSDAYRPIVVHNGSSLYSAGDATGKPRYNYTTGDIKAKSFTTDGGSFNGNATSATKATQDGSGRTITTTYSTTGHTHSQYAASGTVTALDTRVGTAETNITNLQSAVNGKAPNNHASTGTTYGIGKTGSTYGHVKLVTGNLNGQKYADGVAAAAAHTHSQYSGTGHTHAGVYAPVAHASSATTYGLGTTANYGHVKISNGDVSTVASADGLVAGMDHSHGNYSLTGHTHSQYAATGTVSALETRITKIEGNDAGSSMRTVAADEVAKVVAKAPAAFDTLKEIADWIGTGNTNTTATQMITDIAELKGTVSGFTSDTTVKATTTALQSDINGKAPKAHSSTATTYGLGNSGGTYGHVKLVTGEVSGQTYANGVAAAAAHSHGNYAAKTHTHGTITLSGDVTGSASIGSGTTAINITTTVADDSHNHTYLKTVGDTRAVATKPSDYANNLIYQGLKSSSSINSPSSDSYSYLLGLRGWSDSSGGDSWELAFNNSGINARHGATDAWGSWKKIAWTSDIPTTLKNPNAIKFKNASGTTITYDGSSVVDLTGGVNYAASAATAASATKATTAGTATSATKATNIANGAAGSIPYQSAANKTTFLAKGSAGQTLKMNSDATAPVWVTDLYEKTVSLKVTTDWMDTGINAQTKFGDIVLPSGTYAVQITPQTSGQGSLWSEIHSGMMSWYSGTTNSSDSDEIFLHKAGHASNNSGLFLRTVRVGTSGYLKLQIASKTPFDNAVNITFKFKKLI